MMSQTKIKSSRRPALPKPTWDVALLFPREGDWTEIDYLDLDTNHLVELSHGCLEVLPMPTTTHQLIVMYLLRSLAAFVTVHQLGIVLPAALPVRLWRGKLREPDIVFLLAENAARARERFWLGADLVMEVVSPGKKDRRRDLVIKREEYARARIPEYWIIDPKEEHIIVLKLADGEYVVHGTFPKGTIAASLLLPGFSVDVSAALNQQILSPQKPTRRKKA
jgi:Uma2 family endonuclease